VPCARCLLAILRLLAVVARNTVRQQAAAAIVVARGSLSGRAAVAAGLVR
jgi:hypothetical protein